MMTSLGRDEDEDEDEDDDVGDIWRRPLRCGRKATTSLVGSVAIDGGGIGGAAW